MPRKEAKSVKAEDAEEEEGQGGVCYLDTFLNSITETHDLPREFKANLALMRKFQNNVQEVEAIFGRLPFRLPELPEEARVDTRLIRS